MPKQKSARPKIRKEPVKKFSAQILCPCRKNCANNIDVEAQMDIFHQFQNLRTWSKQTRYLRSLANSQPCKENIDPIISKSKKKSFSGFILPNLNGQQTKVCMTFLTKLLQVNRKKIHRAVSSIVKNPNAVDKRGKTANSRKISAMDTSFVKRFIGKFASYESIYDSLSRSMRYLHPNLNLRKMYKMYEEECGFTGRKQMSSSMFRQIFNTSFDLAFVRLTKRNCHVCRDLEKKKVPLVSNIEAINEPKKMLKEHKEIAMKIKNDLIEAVDTGSTSHQ